MFKTSAWTFLVVALLFCCNSEVTAAGAGDIAIRGGVDGSYRLPKLVIDADGDASNIDAAVMDGLRNYGLVPIDVQGLNILDNQ